MKKNNSDYEYSALSEKEKQEIENIKNKYEQPNKDKNLVKLKKLHGKVKYAPIVFAYCFGALFVLLFGLGLTMILEWKIYVWGILLSTISLLFCALTYPLYRMLHIKVKTKYSDEIIEISHNILESNNEESK